MDKIQSDGSFLLDNVAGISLENINYFSILFSYQYHTKEIQLHIFLKKFKYNKMINLIVQEQAIRKRHQAYRIAAVVHNARLKPKS